MPQQNLDPHKLEEENLLLKQALVGYRNFLVSFSEACAEMSAISDADKLIAFFVGKLSELFKASRVSFMFFDRARGELFLKASEGLSVEAGEVKIKMGEAFGGWVARDGNPLLVKDVETEYPELAKNRVSRYMTKSFMILPVKNSEGLIGVLSLTDKKDGSVFSEEDLQVFTLLGRSLALHIENIRLSQKNKILADRDPLTGLATHPSFQEELLEEIGRAERYRRPLSLIMLDVDNFAAYNKDYGYATGDSILNQIAAILNENTRKIDFVSRFGPEEFMVILPETRLKDAVIVGEKIREKISSRIFARQRTSSLEMLRVTASIGAAEHQSGLANEEFIKRVSQALKEAKQKGKNRVCAYR